MAVTKKSAKPSTTTNDILANATTALNIANNFGSLIPIPLVASLIQTAQVILATAQSVRKNKRDCAELANRSAELARLIKDEVHGREDLVNDRLRTALENLSSLFREVKEFVQELGELHIFGRIGKRDSIATKVNEFTAKLNFMMQMFQTTSSLRMELKVEEVVKGVTVLNDRAHRERKFHNNGQFRVIRRGDVDIRAQLIRPNPSDNSYEYLKADMKGRAVTVVRTCISRETALVPLKQTRIETTETLYPLPLFEKLWHPNIAQLEGYSDPSCSGPQFAVFKGDLLIYETYIASLPRSKRALERLRLHMELIDAQRYLVSQEVFLANDAQSTVDISSGRLVVGVDGKFEQVGDVLGPAYDFVRISDLQESPCVAVFQEYMSSPMAMTINDALDILSKHVDLSRRQSSFTYTDSDEPLYLYSGIAMAHDWLRPNTAYTFLEFVKTGIQPISLDWPPILNASDLALPELASGEKTSLDISTLPIMMKSSRSKTGRKIQSKYYETSWDDQQMKSYLLRRAWTLCTRHDAEHPEHICIVYKTSFRFEAILHKRGPSEKQSRSEEELPVYFHISPMEGDCVPVPWAYFSFDREPVEGGKDSLMKRARGNQRVCDRFISNLPGVDAEVFVSADCSSYGLQVFEADFLKRVHEVFDPAPTPSAHIEEITEA